MHPLVELFYRLGTALAIGFFIGLQREFSQRATTEASSFAGTRTFALLGLTGALAALAAERTENAFILIAVLAVVGGLIVASYTVTSRQGDVGTTTEVSALVTVLTGALCYWGEIRVAVAVGVATAFILSVKVELMRFVEHLTRDDLMAALKFGVVTAIVLPVLPDRSFDRAPFDVLSPYHVWLMVVLITGISFVGYVLVKVAGPRQGIGVTGFLGGLVSSTAVTLSFAQRSRGRQRLAKPFAMAIVLAWITMFLRILVEVAIVNRSLLPALWLPMLLAAGAGIGYGVWLYRSESSRPEEEVALSNPVELGPALRFGVLYAVVLLASRAAQLYLGDRGAYLSAVVTGVADVDAITLTMAKLSRPDGATAPAVAVWAILLAALTNTVVKGGIVLATAEPALKRRIWPGVAAILAGGIAGGLL